MSNNKLLIPGKNDELNILKDFQDQITLLEKEYGQETIYDFIKKNMVVDGEQLVDSFRLLQSSGTRDEDELKLIEDTLKKLDLLN